MDVCRILLTRSMAPGDIQYLRDKMDPAVAGRYEFIVPEAYDEESLCALAGDADVLLGPYVTPEILKRAGKLKLIQVPWTGMDTFDFSAVQGCRVPVCNTHSNADSVAEMGLAILLDLLKKVSYHDRKMRAGSWNRDQKPLNLKSRMLGEQTVCILGCGNIGYRMAKLIRAFGAKVVGVDVYRQPDEVLSAVYPPEKTAEVLAGAGAVICALPLTADTRGLIDDKWIAGMKRGAVLVNMSRAGVMDEDAVYRALRDGRLAGFGADVWWRAPRRGESESWPSDHNAFWEMDQVVMSPHRAGFVEDSLPHLDGAADNLIALIQGKPLRDRVDTAQQY